MADWAGALIVPDTLRGTETGESKTQSDARSHCSSAHCTSEFWNHLLLFWVTQLYPGEHVVALDLDRAGCRSKSNVIYLRSTRTPSRCCKSQSGREPQRAIRPGRRRAQRATRKRETWSRVRGWGRSRTTRVGDASRHINIKTRRSRGARGL